MASKRSHESIDSQHKIEAPTPHEIWVSPSPIYDRQSIFKAYFSPSMPAPALRKHLKSLDEVKSATHHVLAWRLPRSEEGTLTSHFQPSEQQRPDGIKGSGPTPRPLETGADDDGEHYAGRHVLRVLEAEGAQGALVMARWYGGVLLGPVRFTHIADIARQAIREWRRESMLCEGGEADGGTQKRVKAANDPKKDEETKERLVRELTDRDANILVLRELLKTKREAVSKTTAEDSSPKATIEESSPEVTKEEPPQMATIEETSQKASADPVGQSGSSPAKKMDYADMTLDALRRIDKARDSTVAFLLKKIEEVEEAEMLRESNSSTT